MVTAYFMDGYLHKNGSYTQNSTVNLSSSQSIEQTIGYIIYYYGIFCVIFVVNICGNTLVICTMLRHRALRQPCNYILLSLAVSDIFIGVIYPLYNVSHLDTVPGISRPLEMKI
ncbi:hypothetical protein KUTeg_007506 [Tegillarca granosa]|uniref:G-protein coupled receptors family 1 profile domain-containing protein n=1 Tax=Tegillarca granosa TaxID=220873 RepID=A0ABQ9FGS2_TEGGR|nr:hypothetical protein KUTeg_007506 [Tegillarca granosa]